MHNRLFLALALAALVSAVYQMFQPDGLAFGYGIIALLVIVGACRLWSKRRTPKATRRC